MVSYTCRNCGAQLELSDAGGFTCTYCGSRAFMSDSELKGNMEFRKKILSYYKAKVIEKEEDYSGDTLWEETGKATYKMKNGQLFTITYMDKYVYPKMLCYLARKNIVYIVHDSLEANLFLRRIDRIVFPAADTKLVRCFPIFQQKIELNYGR